MLKLLIVFTLLNAVFTLPASQLPPSTEKQEEDCMKVLMTGGASIDFGSNVGHAIHSLTVRALKKFDPNITEDNKIPTINMDLSADEAILPYAPDRRGPSDKMFFSEGMKTLDEVLSHMDDKTYDIKFFTPLEKVAHAFHMEEMWAMVLHNYKKLKANPPKAGLCKCAMDIESNGVLKMLRFTALAIREPQLIYGNKMDIYKKGSNGYSVYYPGYTYHFKLQEALRDVKKDWSSDQLLLQQEQSMPRLVDANSWQKWKDMSGKAMREHIDLALFLFCALN